MVAAPASQPGPPGRWGREYNVANFINHSRSGGHSLARISVDEQLVVMEQLQLIELGPVESLHALLFNTDSKD